MKCVTLHNATAWSIRSATLALFALLVVMAADAQAITIPMVTVGNPGNSPDTRYNSISVGSVDHAYKIGTYEVTAGQYTEFLNAVAQADPNGLYNTSMVSTFGANIQRTGSSPNFSYSVAADWANRPVNFVSFWDAARFANWLHNGQPVGPQGPGTTEGGAYLNMSNNTTFARQPGAKFFIPTQDEWYKAAYHDKTAGLAATYLDYPTGTNGVPGRNITETTKPGNNANYYNSGYVIGSPYYRTEAGEFELSDSPYGTFDQGGNLWEWNETVPLVSTRLVRGGSFDSASFYLIASARGSYCPPTDEGVNVGFRVASIPELTLPGDYNGNGIVDAADYTVWRKGFGTVFTQNDYNVWRADFGQTAESGLGASANATIPEPGTLMLLMFASVGWYLRRGRAA